MKSRNVILGVVAGAFAALAAAPAAGAATFSNPTPITTSGVIQGLGSPYPSPVAVSGVPGKVSSVGVTVRGLTTNGVRALELALVAPDGTAVEVMRRVGDAATPVANVTYRVEDSALGQFPATGGPPTASYKPTNYAKAPPPAPDDPFGSACPIGTLYNPGPAAGSAPGTMAVFNGLEPNGTWSLCVINTLDGYAAQFAAGWSLDVAGATGQREAALKKCKKKKSKHKRRKCRKKAKKLPL